jgi:hypothetical protein
MKAIHVISIIFLLLMGLNLKPLSAQEGKERALNVKPYHKGDLSNFPVYPPSQTPEPKKGQCVDDDPYGTSVCKAVDAKQFPNNESNGVVRPVYSRWRIDNSAGNWYYVIKEGETPSQSGKGQMVILNAKDDSIYKVASEVDSGESAEFRWDYSGDKPAIMYYVEGCQFRQYDVKTGETALIRDFTKEFPNCGRILNDVEGDSSGDSNYWAWMVQGAYKDGEFPMIAVITYDKKKNAIIGTLDYAKYQAMGGKAPTLPKPNMVDISPLGSKVVALFGRTDKKDVFDGPHAYNLDFSNPVKVCNDETHSGWGFDYEGSEVFVCQVNNDNWQNSPADTIAYTNIKTGKTNVILFHEDLGWDVGGFHFGRFYKPSIKGWVYMTTYSENASKSWMRNQAVMLELKPYQQNPKIWRIADTHNHYPSKEGYSREAYSPISADGSTIYWGADWRGGDGTVDVYKVRLPEQWQEKLKTATP